MQNEKEEKKKKTNIFKGRPSSAIFHPPSSATSLIGPFVKHHRDKGKRGKLTKKKCEREHRKFEPTRLRREVKKVLLKL